MKHNKSKHVSVTKYPKINTQKVRVGSLLWHPAW